MGGVILADADEHNVYLRSDIPESSWDDDLSTFKFTYSGNTDGYDIYTYSINAESLNQDIYFRFHVDNWDYQFAPNSDTDSGNYTFSFADGKSDTYNDRTQDHYGINVHYNNIKSDSRTFCIPHSSIKASEYTITLKFEGYDNGNDVLMFIDIVSMPATVSDLGYATFSCNRALDFSDVTGLSAYKASLNEDNKVVLTKVTGTVAAGTGLLLAGSTTNIPVVETSAGTDISSSNLLKASVTATEVAASTTGAYHYFLAGTSAETVGFYNVATAATSGAGNAYLETTTALATESTGARVAWIFENDGTTGIDSAKHSAERSSQNTLFDLEGRAVAQPTKGLYIKNGKKVIVR